MRVRVDGRGVEGSSRLGGGQGVRMWPGSSSSTGSRAAQQRRKSASSKGRRGTQHRVRSAKGPTCAVLAVRTLYFGSTSHRRQLLKAAASGLSGRMKARKFCIWVADWLVHSDTHTVCQEMKLCRFCMCHVVCDTSKASLEVLKCCQGCCNKHPTAGFLPCCCRQTGPCRCKHDATNWRGGGGLDIAAVASPIGWPR